MESDDRLSNFAALSRSRAGSGVRGTQAYIPDDKAALKVSRGKRWSDLGQEQLIVMSRKAGLPEGLVPSAAVETVAAFRQRSGVAT